MQSMHDFIGQYRQYFELAMYVCLFHNIYSDKIQNICYNIEHILYLFSDNTQE